MCENNKKSDKLELCGLEVSCIIGDLPDERINEQTLLIDVTLSLDLSIAASSDDLDDTVDYAELCEDIKSVLRRAECRMLERAADCVAFVSLRDSRVKSVRVRIEKKERVPGLRAAAVVIERDDI
ncbi:MAG: dihydroneopterin aldolase [Kiritimatiellae bacterium]|jgi:dihydroneopterin aldolase|nr:dihydroneopterin aldolase [Kiritimatiellia bacterium]